MGLISNTTRLFDFCADTYLSEDHCWGGDLDTIHSYLSQFDKPDVLDLGCGTGWHLATILLRFRSRLGTVVGLDYSAGMLNTASNYLNKLGWNSEKPRYEVTLIRGNALAIPFRSRSFDIILLLNNTLGNISAPTFKEAAGYRLKVLKDVFDLLKPGGYLILTVYNADKLDSEDISGKHFRLDRGISDLSNFDLVRTHYKYGIQFYSHWFTESEVAPILFTAGYSIIETEQRRKRIVVVAQRS